MATTNRKVSVSTPLGDDTLIFRSMSGSEEMGRLFEFDVELIRQQSDGSVDAKDLLGNSMTISLEMPNTTERYFNGSIVQFRHTGFVEGYYTYRAILKPALWFLTRRSNCRIFQEKTIPDIIKELIAEYSSVDVEYKIESSYDTLDYCVQYRESDFDFISRLMEHAGIFYYFKHENQKHTLVVTDNSNNFQSITDYTTIPYYPPGNNASRDRDHIYEWSSDHNVQSGTFVLDDYDFEAPSTDLTAKSTQSPGHTSDNLEVYDYPGKYTQSNSGTSLTDTRIEELHTQFSLSQGQSNALAIQPGMKFTLSDFYFEDQNCAQVITSAQYHIQGDNSGSVGSADGSLFEVSFTALNSQQQYRSQSITPKPVISGSQTAVVVGKDGEEIWTDKYGRVKVQFHWDRVGENNENSSCWVRVSYPTAGKSWGWVSLPRMDQEVIVSFLEGDPDRPMITGRVYNAEQMPPYDLPTNQTQSGIKTRSSKDGTADNFNEIRFEDKKDEEEIYVHAEKDYNRVVENNDTLKVGFDDQDAGDQTIDIYNDRTVTLDQGNDTLTVKTGDHTTTIESGDHDTTIKSGDHSLDISSGSSSVDAGQKIEITAGTSITLTVGSNSIKIDNSGVTIKGTMIKVEGTATAEVKSPMTTVKGDGMLTLKGGVTMIN